MRIALVLLLAGAGCLSGRSHSEPLVGPATLDTPVERHGERVYMEFCYQCHPGGDAGLGPAVGNKALPRLAVRLQVRKGFGRMPAFGDDVIDDRSLTALLDYMKTFRSKRAR